MTLMADSDGARAAEVDMDPANPAGWPDTVVPDPEMSEEHTAAPRFPPRFQNAKYLGGGGMGVVYRVEDVELGRPVAFKFPKAERLEDEYQSRFHKEARAAARLRHANICQVHDVGQFDGKPYLVMDYIEGESLDLIVKGKLPMPPYEAATIVRTLALALQHAHENGIIHRDLKPSNIMVEKATSRVVITDFGLAKILDATDLRKTPDNQLLGTPLYMAPEQAAGNANAVGPGADIYSLGMVLYELLTAKLPFSGSLREVLSAKVNQDPDPPSHHQPGLDGALDKICRRAIAKDCGDRYISMAKLAGDLSAWLRTHEVGVSTTSLILRTPTPSPPNPRPQSGAAAWTTFLARRPLAVRLAIAIAGVVALGCATWIGGPAIWAALASGPKSQIASSMAKWAEGPDTSHASIQITRAGDSSFTAIRLVRLEDTSLQRTQDAPSSRPTLWISCLPMTKEEFELVARPPIADGLVTGRPINNVSWTDATNFCESLQAFLEQHGLNLRVRLPTELEWEAKPPEAASLPEDWGEWMADPANKKLAVRNNKQIGRMRIVKRGTSRSEEEPETRNPRLTFRIFVEK